MSARDFICGVPYDAVDEAELRRRFATMTEPGSDTSTAFYVNAHVHNLARADPSLRAILCDSDLCYADGAAIVWAARVLGLPRPSRLTAADFLPRVLADLGAAGRGAFLLAGKPGIAERAAEQLSDSLPAGTIAGAHHGYFDVDNTADIERDIADAAPELLVVGLGTPRQERWISETGSRLGVPCVWAVGAVLDYIAGVERRSPSWMGDAGLEWLYRLAMDPRGKARRYLLGNPAFVAAVMRQRLGR